MGYSVLLTEAATQKGAVCLDGSPARYYISPSSTDKHKFAMFLQGGGWCSGLYHSNGKGFDACWDRRIKKTGSTTNDAETKDFNKVGFLQNNPITNPLLFSWTKIYVRYCDGGSFSGDVSEPLQDLDDTNRYLFFRGKRILDAIFESLIQDYNLSNATHFVFGGGSAGGLAAFLHADYVANKYFDLNKTKFVAFPIVGFFIDYNDHGHSNYSDGMKWVFKHQNISSSSILSPYCFQHNANDTSKCIFAQNIAGNITVPVFISNSEYDEWQATNILGTGSSNPSLLNEYGRNFTSIIFDNVVSQNERNGNIYGVFIISCFSHGSHYNNLPIDNYTLGTAFKVFYESLGMSKARRVWHDSQSFPCHQCCDSHIKHTQIATNDITNNATNSVTYYPSNYPSVAPTRYKTKFPSEFPSEFPIEYRKERTIWNTTMSDRTISDYWYDSNDSIFGKYAPSNIFFDIFMVCLIVVIGLLIIGVLFWCGWLKGCTDVIWNTCCCGRYTQIN